MLVTAILPTIRIIGYPTESASILSNVNSRMCATVLCFAYETRLQFELKLVVF